MPDYTRECLRADDEFILYRGRANDAEVPSVLLRTLASARPALESLQKIDNEYSLRDDLDTAWALRPLVLSQYNGQKALVLEDPGGEPLDRLIRGPMDILQFLRIAAGLATALSQVHKRKLIHKDIKPSNVLVESATGRVWLTGFGIASRLPRERQAAEPPELIAGTLAYMAPEQTGRMNRSIDSRSDLYALGVTFYEMLTGSLPFSVTDPVELVHCHIARQPTPPGERLKALPGMVSAIVMKLLAKTAEKRYQTAVGLERDLRRCLEEWETQNRVDEFRLGEQDIPDRLVIPEKLYGREREIEVLLAAFDRIVAGGKPELVLVSGYSGIGKSSVVNELHKPLVPPRGLFATGKFDQYKRDVPYATIAQAFQSLLHPLLTKSEAELSKWCEALREAVDPNGQLIVDLVPELKFIIGEQPPVPEVSPQDAQARFQLVFARFVSVFARQEHPLALFLDDLQWLDAATLDLIADLLTQTDVRYLLLIGAYRDNEVSPTHPLMRKLEAIRQAGAIMQNIVLAPLSRENLAQLIADCVHCEPERVAPLAELVHEKTAGNPFFAIQFISALAEEGLLAFDRSKAQWFWYLDRILAKGYTDNVVDLLVGKLSRLPTGTQEALRQLACFGNRAEFSLLRVIYRDAPEEMHSQLWEAVRTGFIFRSEDSYRFLHDRVQEAAYSLIPEESRAELHVRIGRLLAAENPPKKLEERIFEVVNQFDRASHLITSVEERERVAELNLIAARRAKNSIAYGAAIKYLAAGRAMLTEGSWGQRYELIFSIEYLRAECELLTADMEAAEKRLSMLAARANRAHDLAVVTRLQVTLYTALDRVDRCVEICLEYLRRGGTNWSTHPTSDDVQREYDRIWSLLGDRQIVDLLDLSLVDNLDILDVLEVLTEFLTPAMFFDQDLSALVICRMVNLSLEHGNSDASCLAYAWFGIIAGPRFGEYEGAFKFGQLGYDLLERRGLKRYEARTCMWFGLLVPWTKHARCCRDFARHCFDVAYRVGDFTYAAYSFTLLITSFLFVGDPLAEAQAEAEKGVEFAERARVGLAADIVRSDIQLIRTLRGLTNNFGSFNDKDFDEAAFEEHLASNPALAQVGFGYWTLKAEARFFAGNYASAVDASSKAEQLLWAEPTVLELAPFRFYGALSHAAAWDSASPDERQQHFEVLAAHQKQLEIWAEYCPANFEDRVALTGAEIARIEGRLLDAEGLYKKAVRSAHANGFIHDEAVAFEVAARFYAARGFDKIADAYLREARYCYLRWGANGKVTQLDQLNPHIKEEQLAPGPTSTIIAPTEFLDLATVIRVSQTVSAEMDLDKLIDSVMRAAIEHAGAARGLLVLSRGDGQRIEAEATTIGDEVMLRRKEGALLSVPQSVVNYVVRTHEFVILDDASSENRFATDTYFSQHHARSVLCLPLITQGKLVGLLYLENNLAPNVFTPNRIAVLRLLASQAAISVENTRLYADLRQREAKIRRLVEANVVGIVMWNLEGVITGANEAFLRMVQYDREDLASGRVRWTDLTPAEWRDRDERAIAELRAGGVFQPVEKEYFRKDGTRVPILVGGALFEDSVNEGVAFILDLSDQKRAEEALRRSEKELRDVIDTIPAMVWTGLPDGSNAFVSKRWTEYIGLAAAEAAGSGWQAAVHPEDLQQQLNKWRESLATGKPLDDESRFRRAADSAYRWMLVRCVPFRDEHGQILRWYGTLTDIEDRKRAEAEIRALKDQLYRENLALRDEIDRASMFEEIVGTSDVLRAVLSGIAKVAPTDSTVFITGETGTGKELIARAVHKRSRRSGRAFVSVNCAALAPSLISSELFGHEKGAFTGATQRRLGRFELADGGTIFLDEVGELPPDTQVALLRVLQEREFERVGGTQSIKVDVRVIAATNRDLKTAVGKGTFREDLFYRLNVFPIEVPPLRERREDILMLVEYFVQRYAKRAGKNIQSIDKKTLELLRSYDWPGNIRELQNVIERSVILSSGDVLSVDGLWLSKESHPRASPVEASEGSKSEGERWNEREIIEAALAESRGRVSGPSGAANKLGIPASTLYHTIKALKIDKKKFKFR